MPLAAPSVWSTQVHKSACDIRVLPQGESPASILPAVTWDSSGPVAVCVSSPVPASGLLLRVSFSLQSLPGGGWGSLLLVGDWRWMLGLERLRDCVQGKAWLCLFYLCVGNHSLLDAGTLTKWVRVLCSPDRVMVLANLWCKYCCSPSFAHEDDWAMLRLNIRLSL